MIVPRRWIQSLVLAPLPLVLAGCYAPNHTAAGVANGTGLGALAGGIIGHQSGHTGAGALIGAATGAFAGGMIGSSQDAVQDAHEERDAALRHAQLIEQNRNMMTNNDLVRMTQSGISDDVIVGTIHSRGGRFDLSPDAMISLKASGVSDRVLLAVQQNGAAPPPPIVDPPHMVVVPPPPVGVGVVVAPRPVYVYPRRHWRRW